MKYLAGLMILVVAVAGFVLADEPAMEDAALDPLVRFRRDQHLIDALVEGGLRLASEDDALARAGTCNGLADQLAHAIKQAAADKNMSHAAALARHLEAMLVRGVAFNVTLAKKADPDNKSRQAALEGFLRDMDRFTAPAEESLRRVPSVALDENDAILRPLHHGRAVVQRAVRGEEPGLILPDSK